jgi:hypothetical protein
MVPYPTQVVKNQFGEQYNNFILGGSSVIDFNFIVDSANGNGLGIRSLKGSPLVSAVFMHTSATPLSGNPNPLAGGVLVQFSKAFQGYDTGFWGCGSPLSGTPVNITSGLTIHQTYTIVSVGTSTVANWQAVGLPSNIVPAVGASFVATTASAGTGTGVVEVSSSSGIDSLELCGDPNQTCNPASGGGYLISQFLLNGTKTQPADNTVVGMRVVMLNPTAGPIN